MDLLNPPWRSTHGPLLHSQPGASLALPLTAIFALQVVNKCFIRPLWQGSALFGKSCVRRYFCVCVCFSLAQLGQFRFFLLLYICSRLTSDVADFELSRGQTKGLVGDEVLIRRVVNRCLDPRLC